MEHKKIDLSFMKEMRKDYRAFFTKLINEHGSAITLKGPTSNLHILSDPSYYRHVLIDNGINYIHPPNKMLDEVMSKNHSYAAKVASEIERSRERVDSLDQTVCPNSINIKADVLINNACQILDTWKDKFKDKPIPIIAELMPIATKNLTDLFFNSAPLEPYNLLRRLQDWFYYIGLYEGSLTKLPWKLPTYTYFKSKKIVRNLRLIMADVVTYCLASPSGPTNVIKKIAETYFPNFPNVDEEEFNLLMQRVIEYIGGSTENVSLFLTFALSYYSRYPELAKKVYGEIQNVVGDRKMTFEDISQLNYTRAFICESLRFTAGSIIPRYAVNDDMIGNYKINKHDRILVPVFYIHRDPKHWDNPEGFNPDRFMPAPEFNDFYLPFGLGVKNCFGRHFAMLQLVTVFTSLLQRYQLDLAPSTNIGLDMHVQNPANKLIFMNLR